MSHEIDGTRAIYARHPAWHGIGTVKQDGWFSSAEALHVLNPNKDVIRKMRALAVDPDDPTRVVETDEYQAIMRKNPDTGLWQILSYMSPEYGVIQIEDQFAFLDEVVAEYRKSEPDGNCYYETAGLLRNGKQVFVTIDLGALVLDPGGREDRTQRYLFASNSYDGSWAFRVKKTNIRVECANMAAMALRGSSNQIVDGDWSTRHTKDVLRRVEVAKSVLGMSARYDVEFASQAEMMIETPITEGTLERLLVGLFTAENAKTGTNETDQEAIGVCKTVYELSPTCQNIYGTVWGGLQSVIEYADWKKNVRGGRKTSLQEARLRKQMGETDKGFKQSAWDAFYGWTKENPRPKVVSMA